MGARRGRKASASFALAPLLVVVGVALVVMSARARSSSACAGQYLTPAQLGNARLIYDVGVGMGLPQGATVIAIATAMQESKLENIPYGTADSLGLFQQRPSQGWGSPRQIMQPDYAARAFYADLARVPGWQTLPLTVAAQDVQHSAYPDAYAQWQPLATALTDSFSGGGSPCQ
jgi:hypothetical protein